MDFKKLQKKYIKIHFNTLNTFNQKQQNHCRWSKILTTAAPIPYSNAHFSTYFTCLRQL